MWTVALEWIKGIGLGSLIGVLIGARLARQSQDRQFDRQAIAQRADRARAIYQEAVVLGHRLTSTLAPNRAGQLPPQGTAETAEAVHEALFEATVRLRTEGVSTVGHQYERAMVQSHWMCAVIIGELEERPLPEPPRYWAAWHELVAELDAADMLWTQWQAAQTSRTQKSRQWLRSRRSDRRLGNAGRTELSSPK